MNKVMKVAVAAILTAATVAGCSGGGQTGQNEKADSGGSSAVVKAPVKFSMARGTWSRKGVEASPDINKEKWILELEKRTNVDLNIQLLPHNGFNEKVSLMFASNDIPDLLVAYQSMTPSSKDMKAAVDAGMFRPLDDLIQSHGQNLLKAIPKEAWEEVTYKGKIYAIPQYLSIPSRRATFIRQDLLEKTGLPAPKTVDDLLNVLRAMKKNGLEQPFGIRENFKYADNIFGAYDVLPYSTMYEKQGDQIVPKFFDSENMMKALQVYKTMYDEGLMAKDFATVTGAVWTKNRDAGKYGVWTANAATWSNFDETMKKAVPGIKTALIPSPVGPDGKGGMMLYGSTLETAYINAKTSKETAEGIVKFLDWMVTPEADTFFNFGIEGETFKKENGKVVYEIPTDPDGLKSLDVRVWSRVIMEGAYNKDMLAYESRGGDLLKAFNEVLPTEGRGGVLFDPELKAYGKYPDLAPKFDEPAKLITDHMVKMIFGKEPISDWPKVIEEWKAKGGNEIIKEATERFNNKDGVRFGPDSKI
jgi:putative aldouronate transport system substrate-binding protein